MTYKEFYTAATEGINFKTISKDDMQFAYIMFHQTFGEAPKKAIESVKFLDALTDRREIN